MISLLGVAGKDNPSHSGLGRPTMQRYPLAVGLLLLAVLLRLPIEYLQAGESHFPFTTFSFAVAFSAWWLGRGPTLLLIPLSIIACGFISDYVPILSFAFLFGSSQFVLLGLIIAFLVEGVRKKDCMFVMRWIKQNKRTMSFD